MTTTPNRPRVRDGIPGQRAGTPDRTRGDGAGPAPRVPRVLTDVHHGGHVLADEVPTVDPDCASAEGMRWVEVEERSTPFGYMFEDLQGLYPCAHLPIESSAAVVACLKALGAAMVEQPPSAAGDSTVPAIYTYWGQFVDHDLTANTDRDDDISITDLPLQPLQPEKVVRKMRNLRQPQLNLDSVYGNGPQASGQEGQVPYDGDRLAIGDLSTARPPGNVAVPGADLPRDEHGKARIGDGRNDENLIVAQLHLAFLRFHNEVLAWMAEHPGSEVTGDGTFARARQLVQWHYQWITVHDFLKRIADPAVVDGLLDGSIPARLALDETTPPGKVFMPLEFSVAAYRFGHSMIRGAYDWNENFGAPGTRLPSSPFGLLFLFTGNGGLGGDTKLPDNWPARFERLTGAEERPADTPDNVPVRVARKIDTRIASPLADLSNEGTSEISDRTRRMLKRLAVRNLLRGYRLAIPTGQAVARSLGIPSLRREELIAVPGAGGGRPVPPSPVDDALIDGGFLEDTPLWFYVLKEAEVLGQGERLGPVGSRIVAETIIGQLRADPTSFLNGTPAWDPSAGVTLAGGQPVDSITAFLRFAKMHP
ncbi:peroxidase family protein [Blastococcus sp. VKM Ac-2987]|uniref:peroxidase family protein n=1 Tax=Blastococcus sp. VKM Ac-2987 TaxID=3004141 RepID=UPI0022AB7BC1|nr:heme peroxidase family protein [Blastococcus sp. VKM Ac-2987]MCZ2860665.1 heme peroxidase family protein [Blastococcus sp. VKM Ac-2987]